jgi:thiol-disulfide isomerase/thioredoxin
MNNTRHLLLIHSVPGESYIFEDQKFKMRTLFLLLMISIRAAAQQAVVTGTVPAEFAGRSVKLTLINYETRNDSLLQEAAVSSNGAFKFSIKGKQPEIYDVAIGNTSLVQVLAKPGDKIHLIIGKDSIQVTGSIETQYLIAYEANRKRVFNKYLKRTYESSAAAVESGDKQRIEYWNVQHEQASVDYKAELAVWVEQPFFLNSLAAVHHSIRWNSETDTALMDRMVAIYKKKYPNYDLTRQLVNKVNATERIAIGAIAPEFVAADTAGNQNDFNRDRKKYTLLEFWASWCAPCREESPTLVRLYDQYKDRGFTIVSVSIDKNATQWKNAIRHDGYTWPNVCDYNGYGGPTAALYTVTAVPNSFLLDQNGRIIAKNLRGKLLEDELAELMGARP